MVRCAVISLVLALCSACGSGGTDSPGSPDATPLPDAGPQYPLPNSDLVPAVGSESTLDIATWNIENFPWNAATPSLVADLIVSMELDFIAVQEIEDLAAFDELVSRLRGYGAHLSSHTFSNGNFQKVGFIYKRDLLTVDEPFLLFENDGYEFPRPPMQVRVVVGEGTASEFDFTAITVHLKAGSTDEDRDRRIAAMGELEAHVRRNVDGTGDSDILLLGDFNQTLLGSESGPVYAPFTDEPGRYQVATEELAIDGVISHLRTFRLIDHHIITASLQDELAGGNVMIPALDDQLDNYFEEVSDHLPVVVRLPL